MMRFDSEWKIEQLEAHIEVLEAAIRKSIKWSRQVDGIDEEDQYCWLCTMNPGEPHLSGCPANEVEAALNA